jgi:hypothetical protein
LGNGDPEEVDELARLHVMRVRGQRCEELLDLLTKGSDELLDACLLYPFEDSFLHKSRRGPEVPWDGHHDVRESFASVVLAEHVCEQPAAVGQLLLRRHDHMSSDQRIELANFR